ncbi:hypothetical protein PV413_24785, partial [Streptomyces scabiei]|uniref:hypothetical protein n=1 Tax=Streptomyces scabiei TaxID=1930 RepID=UPI0029AD64F1
MRVPPSPVRPARKIFDGRKPKDKSGTASWHAWNAVHALDWENAQRWNATAGGEGPGRTVRVR